MSVEISSLEDTLEERMIKYKEIVLQGQFERAAEQIRSEENWNWLTLGNLKRERD